MLAWQNHSVDHPENVLSTQSNNNESTISSAPAQDLPTAAGAVELEENDLDLAVGGRKSGEGQKDFLKITMKEVFIS